MTDRVSSRPNFCILVYPRIRVEKDLFSVLRLVSVLKHLRDLSCKLKKDFAFQNGIIYYYHLMNFQVPTTIHLCSNGEHEHGICDTNSSVNE
jgi:hypothetical protein